MKNFITIILCTLIATPFIILNIMMWRDIQKGEKQMQGREPNIRPSLK